MSIIGHCITDWLLMLIISPISLLISCLLVLEINERHGEVSHYNHGFIYFSFQHSKFLFYVF